MSTAFLITTTSCTRECPYCFYVTGVLGRTAPGMGGDELAGCIRTLADRGYRDLVLTGGEPLLREDLPEAIEEASRAGARTLLITNGELLTGSLCEKIVEGGLGAVSISVDSMEEGVFKASLGAALLARKAGLPVTLIAVITRRNLESVERLRDWAEGEGIGVIFQPACIPPSDRRYSGLSLHRAGRGEWEGLKAVLGPWARDCGAGGYLDLFFAIYEGTWKRPSHCAMGRGALVVDCDGSVYPCFHRRDLACGSILRDDSAAVFARLEEAGGATASAPCYGEHCLSLFFGQV
jgi:MoaA/NifB/PqqE/SkfB family radical SAM enzyme